jgi:hypothetical protein
MLLTVSGATIVAPSDSSRPHRAGVGTAAQPTRQPRPLPATTTLLRQGSSARCGQRSVTVSAANGNVQDAVAKTVEVRRCNQRLIRPPPPSLSTASDDLGKANEALLSVFTCTYANRCCSRMIRSTSAMRCTSNTVWRRTCRHARTLSKRRAASSNSPRYHISSSSCCLP